SFVAIQEFQLPQLTHLKITSNKYREKFSFLNGKISLYIFIYGQKVYKGTPEGCIDLRSIWGAAPNPARGAASGLCQRDIVPLESRCCRLRRFGALPQTLPEALPLDSAKGTLSLWNPDVVVNDILIQFFLHKSTIHQLISIIYH
ncbi:MAG: hypothetical protein J6K77_02400, partial [Ruminococcus sp.]|nr:hypothetical protein [Ruminococcus sp.]